MKISFVIPAYNEEKYIPDCLRSIFNLPNISDFEVIVVDNNSTDQTAAIVKRDFPAAKLIAEKKKGPAAARNAGARAAQGEFLAFIDADCRVPQDWWKNVAQKFTESPSLVLLQGVYRYYELNSWGQKLLFYISNVFVIQVAEFLLRRLLRLGGPALGGDMIAKKWAFQKIGGFDEQFSFYGEDIDLAKRMMRQGRVGFSPKAWVYSSKRRLDAEGNLKMWWIYTVNAWSTLLFGKVFIKNHRNIR